MQEILNETSLALAESGSGTPRLDAEVLVSRILKTDRAGLYRQAIRPLDDEGLRQLKGWIDRRRRGEPIAYILQEKEFWSLSFEVTNRVLVPRPETEILVEEAVKAAGSSIESPLRILEIGTGSGAIGVALARELPEAQIVATDISPEALRVAARNALLNGVSRRLSFVGGNMCRALRGGFHLLVSNPPYIPPEDYPLLPVAVRDYEPPAALLGGPHGTAFHEVLIKEGRRLLVDGGWLLMEIGDGQRDRLDGLFKASGGYGPPCFRNDYAGIPRVVGARREESHG